MKRPATSIEGMQRRCLAASGWRSPRSVLDNSSERWPWIVPHDPSSNGIPPWEKARETARDEYGEEEISGKDICMYCVRWLKAQQKWMAQNIDWVQSIDHGEYVPPPLFLQNVGNDLSRDSLMKARVYEVWRLAYYLIDKDHADIGHFLCDPSPVNLSRALRLLQEVTPRATDPATSRQAAVIVEANGNAAFQRQLVLDAVRANPGATSAEIAMMAGIDRHAAARRLPELRLAGILANGESRVCRVCGLSSMTWWAV